MRCIFKNSPLVSKRTEPLQIRIIVKYIKEKLVLSIKSTLPCCNDRDRLCDIRQLHSPVKLEPLEAGGLGDNGDGVLCFLLCVVCCVLLCVQEAVVSWVSAVGS